MNPSQPSQPLHPDLLEEGVVDRAAELGVVGEGHGADGGRFHPTQLQHADVVVAGDEEGVMGGGLEVERELAVVRHPRVQAARELQDDALEDRVLLDVPHLDHL